ncbi:hypothetical protein [Alkalibacillus salilacus]|uniref:DUF3221 domain-containing protein n=1 Tax=Alkalibacillus salilacus TaxID=284582 RepID=A0ABT9VIH0_9BACI|nr:hypothetical protein [Alkalibacillus salilacus]MDQ0160756.1 hypothetical protein [Alkalibacillus salilacus]
MKKSILLIALLFLIGLMGCSDDEAHFVGEISGLNETSIELVVAEEDRNPDASYPVYTVKVNEDTIYEGDAEGFSQLATGDNVKVWVYNVGEDNQIDNKTVEKIVVEN